MRYLIGFWLMIPLMAMAQLQPGTWHGALNLPGQTLHIVVHFSLAQAAWSATMDVPEQRAYGIEMENVKAENGLIAFGNAMMNMQYEGQLNAAGDSIKGSFSQSGMVLELNMIPGNYEPPARRRPQTPQPPFPYDVEEVQFLNKKARIKLAGTLTLPKGAGPFPAVALITGSGPQDRDESLLEHKPFAVLADALTRQGIAVLRYDDRGIAKSEGEFATATSADFADDAAAAWSFLARHKRVDKRKIGLIGHSEGGMIAPMVAVQNRKVGFIVLLAGPGVSGREILIKQSEDIMRANGSGEQAIREQVDNLAACLDIAVSVEDEDQAKAQLTQYLIQVMQADSASAMPAEQAAQIAQMQAAQFSSPWMRYFIRHEPRPNLQNLRCPVLALNGAKDLQVDADSNLRAIEAALSAGGNARFEAHKLPGLNHLFQHANTGSPSEYAEIEETFATEVMAQVAAWILKL